MAFAKLQKQKTQENFSQVFIILIFQWAFFLSKNNFWTEQPSAMQNKQKNNNSINKVKTDEKCFWSLDKHSFFFQIEYD